MIRSLCALSLALAPDVVAPSKPDLRAKGIEVTQAFQIYDPTDPDAPENNSIELIEGAATVARVYLSVSTGSTAAGAGLVAVSGRLQVYGYVTYPDVVELEYSLEPDAPVWLGGPGAKTFVSDREVESSTLNFTLPDELPNPCILTAVLDPFDFVDESNEANNACSLTDLAFVCRRTPELAYIPINYIAPDECDPNTTGMPDEALIEPGVGDDFVFGILPVPDDRSQYHAASLSHMDWDVDIDAEADWYESDSMLLDALETVRASMDPVPDFLYGWFRGNPYGGNGLGRVNGTVAFGNTSNADDVTVSGCDESDYGKKFQRTYAHELSHNLGQVHNGTCDGCSEYPTTTAETGMDVEDLLGLGRVKPAGLYDVMTPAKLTAEAWVGEETYRDLLASDDLACSGTASLLDRFVVIGKIEQGFPIDVGIIDPVFRFKSFVAPSTLEPAGTCQLVLRAGDGTVLKTDLFDVHFDADADGQLAETVFSRTIPALAGVHAIELYRHGQLLDVVQRSPNKPALTILAPAQGQVLPATFEVAWTGFDADDDPLDYIVRYSHDGGVHWTPLDVSPEQHQLTVDTGKLAGTSGKGVIQILACDGLNTTVAAVGGLTVPVKKVAKAYIVEPRPYETFREGSLVSLRASAFDLEDGKLEGPQLTWTSDVDGQLGQGAIIQRALSAGTHRITLVAKDADGMTVQREVIVRVIDLHLQQDPLAGGNVVSFRAFGREPGDAVFFLYSLAGAGAGPCLGALQGMCLDLLPPISILAWTPSDASGTASVSFFLPPGLPQIAVATQAVALPDQDDGPSKSNVVLDSIQ